MDETHTGASGGDGKFHPFYGLVIGIVLVIAGGLLFWANSFYEQPDLPSLLEATVVVADDTGLTLMRTDGTCVRLINENYIKMRYVTVECPIT
jgi:hypothetical protein